MTARAAGADVRPLRRVHDPSPPHDRAAERALLGAVLISPGALEAAVAEGLDPADFYGDREGLVFAAMLALRERGEAVDPVTVAGELRAGGVLAEVGGEGAIDALSATTPDAGNARSYARIVRTLAVDRRRRYAALRLAEDPRDEQAREELRAVLDGAPGDGPGSVASSWGPVDLGPFADGEVDLLEPEILSRTDGRALLYRGKVHSLSGESESGKSWVALSAVAECLGRGERVVYLDFEDEPASVVGRLRALGVDREALLSRFAYIRPDAPLDEAGRRELHNAAAGACLAVLDGVTEALALHGYDGNSNADVAVFLQALPRPLAREGAAVLLIDHVVKDREQRGRYALGAQHKLAGVDVAYGVKVLKPFGRGRTGRLKLTVHKDRPGYVRGIAEDGCCGLVELESAEDGQAVSVTVRPPDTPGGETFRPTVLMERVSRAVEQAPGLSKRGIRDAVRGLKNDAKELALELLIAEGFVRVEQDGRSLRHYVQRPYREADDPACARVPDRAPTVPGTVPVHRAHVPYPLRGHRHGHAAGGTPDRAPDADAELTRLLDKFPDLTDDQEEAA